MRVLQVELMAALHRALRVATVHAGDAHVVEFFLIYLRNLAVIDENKVLMYMLLVSMTVRCSLHSRASLWTRLW